MDFQKLVDQVTTSSVVLSVEKTPEGKCGMIRLICGNKEYHDSLKADHMTGNKMFAHELIPNSEYYHYFPKNRLFEEYCFRSAIKKLPVHTYIHSDFFDKWFDFFAIPLVSDRDDIGYCLFTIDISAQHDSRVMTNISQDTAAEVIGTCIKLRGTGDFRKTVNEVVLDIRRICDARHVCLLLMDRTTRKCSMLAEAFDESTDMSIGDDWQDEEHFNLADSWEEIVGNGSCLIVRNEDDMAQIREKNPEWHESLRNANVESLVLFPLKSGGSLLGYVWSTNFEIKKTLQIKETLELTTFFLASEIANYQMVDRLNKQSTTDMLTGVFNRNAMNIRVDAISKDPGMANRSIGLVFADLNGLKRINDKDGHEAGDILIRNASLALQKAFVGDEIYRAGGDEFLVFLPGTTQEIMDQKIERLRELSSGYDILFAVGGCFKEKCTDIRRALHEADEAMYADKRRFYEEHPELDNRQRHR